MLRNWKLTRMSDEALMADYARGDTNAFECLYLRHKSSLYTYLRRQSSNDAISEELAHDTWIAVINQATVYQSSAKFKTWLFRIAHNRLIDYWRKFGGAADALVQEVGHRLESVVDASSHGLEVDELRKSLEVLSAEQTETLLLKIEGFSHCEIADITNTKQETVKSRLRYATGHLRLALEVAS